MQKIWKYISNLGIKENTEQLSKKSHMLNNQLNFLLLVTMLLLFITTFVALRQMHKEMSFGTLRILILFTLCLLNLVAARFGFLQFSRLTLIFLPVIIFLIGPTLIGYVEEESYTYYPYIVICASVLPQLLLHPRDEKFIYWFSVAYYFVLTLFIDKIMVFFGNVDYPIVIRINTFYAFYKIAQVAIFLFFSGSIYYLRNINIRFENTLNMKNKELELQNSALTEQKEMIERQKDELITKEISTWQKLVSIISHEILNSAIPLTNLAGMTRQMLEDESGKILKSAQIGEETTEDIHQSLQIIESRTQALIHFVKATKSLTQIPKPIIRKISVNELFERINRLFAVKIKEKNVQFAINILPPDLSFQADLELIEQVIINLVQNSLEAMTHTPEPFLTLIASVDSSGKILISVSDNGCGIPDEIREKIFLPYYSTKADKSGIGLSLSQQIMMLHNGTIEVSQGPDRKGAKFTLTFN
jgi:signal transduction histidine kinase